MDSQQIEREIRKIDIGRQLCCQNSSTLCVEHNTIKKIVENAIADENNAWVRALFLRGNFLSDMRAKMIGEIFQEDMVNVPPEVLKIIIHNQFENTKKGMRKWENRIK